MNTLEYWVIDDWDHEWPVEIEYTYSYDAGKYWGPMEDSYPESENFEWMVVESSKWQNAIESWVEASIDEDDVYQKVLEGVASSEDGWEPDMEGWYDE